MQGRLLVAITLASVLAFPAVAVTELPVGRVEVMGARFPERVMNGVTYRNGTDAYLMFGGGTCDALGCIETSAIFRYDLVNDTIQRMNSTLETGLYHTSGAWTGRIAYTLSGCTSGFTGPHWGCPHRRIVRYDPDTDNLTVLPTLLPTGFSVAASVWTGQHIYSFGGCRLVGGCPSRVVTRFDPVNETAADLGALLPQGLRRAAAGWNGTHAFVFGGAGSNQILRFNPQNLSFLTMNATLPDPVEDLSVVYSGEVFYLFGGNRLNLKGSDEILKYDPALDVLTPTPFRLPSARSKTSAVWWNGTESGSDGGAFVFGGRELGVATVGPTALDENEAWFEVVRFSETTPLPSFDP
ncbi:MAG: hypothetical protein ACT4PT_10740 [Methanobacteriota archaeon]